MMTRSRSGCVVRANGGESFKNEIRHAELHDVIEHVGRDVPGLCYLEKSDSKMLNQFNHILHTYK